MYFAIDYLSAKNNDGLFYNILNGKRVFLQFERLAHRQLTQPCFCVIMSDSETQKQG
jgi:hypothetical protein